MHLDSITAMRSFHDLTNDAAPFFLELRGQGIHIDAGISKPRQNFQSPDVEHIGPAIDAAFRAPVIPQ